MCNQILKTGDGRILYLFNNNGLCVKNLKENSDKYRMIYEDCVSDFYACDMNGGIGVVCQDKEGSIIFLKEYEESFLKSTLLSNRSKLPYDKHFIINNHNEWLSLFYIVKYQDNSILSFQIIDRENQVPIAVDYVENEKFFSYVINKDIYVFYNKKDEFGYKIYKWSKKEFSEYHKLGDGELVSSCIDFHNNFHIVYVNEKGYFLKNIKTDNKKSEASDYVIDFIKKDDVINMLVENDFLWIVIARFGFAFSKKSNVNFNGFTDTLNFVYEGEFCEYIINANDKNYRLSRCFGYIKDFNPKLILYRDLMEENKKDQFPAVISYDDEMNEFMGVGKKEESKMRIELTKMEIRLREIEDRLKKLEIRKNNPVKPKKITVKQKNENNLKKVVDKIKK